MPNEEADPRKHDKHAAKSCCLAALFVGLGLFLLVFAAIAGIIIVDTINLRGEKMTFSKRVEHYKVAGQFIWYDFKDWVSKKWSGTVCADDFRAEESSPPEPESELDSESEQTSEP